MCSSQRQIPLDRLPLVGERGALLCLLQSLRHSVSHLPTRASEDRLADTLPIDPATVNSTFPATIGTLSDGSFTFSASLCHVVTPFGAVAPGTGRIPLKNFASDNTSSKTRVVPS
jgi:hypothetical protein